MNRKWVALFSQTGSEILNISKELNIIPDIIVTNNYDFLQYPISSLDTVFVVAKHKKLMEWVENLDYNSLITLHGYLRIIPDTIVSKFDVYNGHPALVNFYPELKGKDKQEDVFFQKEKYPTMGSIIHKVTSELDSGEVINFATRENDVVSLEDAYQKLKETSLITWLDFFKRELY